MGSLSPRWILYLRILEVLLLIALLAIALPWMTSLLMSPKLLSQDDFVQYWAAGWLNARRQNPYDPDRILALEYATGHHWEMPLMMWNPPWTLALAMPFALLPYPIARTAWFLIGLSATLWCLDRVGQMMKSSPQRWWVWIVGFTFFPILDTLRVGQFSLLIGAGLAGTVSWMDRHPLLAGGMAFLLTIKPHTTYLLLPALGIWAFSHRRWGFFLGLGGSLMGSLAIAMAFNPAVATQYIEAWTRYPPIMYATPTLGGILRFLLGPERFILQFAGPLVGLSWFVVWLARRWGRWRWEEEIPLVALVSLVTTAYGWVFDLFPAIIALLPTLLRRLIGPPFRKSLALLALYALIQAIPFITTFDQLWYFWFGPALLAWFLLARRHLGAPLLRRDETDETAH